MQLFLIFVKIPLFVDNNNISNNKLMITIEAITGIKNLVMNTIFNLTINLP